MKDMNPIRLSKILISFLVALYFLFVIFNNLTEYFANFEFVSEVMMMREQFSEETTGWRAFPGVISHHLFYIAIILMEIAIFFLCLMGLRSMWRVRFKEKPQFHDSKKWAIYGLTLALLMWVFIFITIGGEWFLMWQSENWNALPTAFNHAILTSLFLIHLTTQND